MTSEARNVSSESDTRDLVETMLVEAHLAGWNAACDSNEPDHPRTHEAALDSYLAATDIAAIQAALTLRDEAFRAGGEWQDIASAPRDGKSFLAYCIERGWGDTGPTYTVQLARWRDSYFASTNGAIPTHWQPLPLPPAQREGEK
jgi:hypothetical protein